MIDVEKIWFAKDTLRDPWIMSLSDQLTIAWIEIILSSDAGGVYEENWDIMKAIIKGPFDETECLRAFKSRLERIDQRHVWIKGYIPFQQPRPSRPYHPQAKVWASIDRWGLAARLPADYLPEGEEWTGPPPETLPLIPGENAVTLPQTRSLAPNKPPKAKTKPKSDAKTLPPREAIDLCVLWDKGLASFGLPGCATARPSGRAAKNIAKILKEGEYTTDDLSSAINAYFKQDSRKIKDGCTRACGNFFGRDRPFVAYIMLNALEITPRHQSLSQPGRNFEE